MAKIVFFDGRCVLCNALADWLLHQILQKNSQCKIQLAPLQGETAQKLLLPSMRQDLNTIVYDRDGHLLTRSTAVLFMLSDLGEGWQLVRSFLILPLWLRDSLYNLLAKNRHRLWPQRAICRVLKTNEKDRLLP